MKPIKKIFFETFISVYDIDFRKSKNTDKNEKSSHALDNEGFAKSSKRKQNLYEKYLNRRTNDTETATNCINLYKKMCLKV